MLPRVASLLRLPDAGLGHVASQPWGAYLLAALASIVALAIALATSPPDDNVPALLFLCAVGISALLGGLGPGLVPAAVGTLAIDYLFEQPRYQLEITSSATVLDMVSFVLVALLVGLLNHQLRLANVRLQRERHRAEAAAHVRDELIATDSHALGRPLTTIKTLLFSLREGGAQQAPEEGRERLLANVAFEVDRLIRLISDALALSQLESAPSARIEWNDVVEIVWAAVDHCRAVLGEHAVNFAVSEELPLVRFDARLLEQALTSVLEHMAAHTSPDSDVWIEAEVADAGHLRLALSDAGPGTPLAAREHMFGRADAGGEGLGLAVARAAVRAQGGRMWIEDSRYGGTCFVMLIPHAAASSRADASPSAG
jgi:two-component system, OmpR family, sensor histidine kinase KdpD